MLHKVEQGGQLHDKIVRPYPLANLIPVAIKTFVHRHLSLPLRSLILQNPPHGMTGFDIFVETLSLYIFTI
jgi:hypothetical protein